MLSQLGQHTHLTPGTQCQRPGQHNTGPVPAAAADGERSAQLTATASASHTATAIADTHLTSHAQTCGGRTKSRASSKLVISAQVTTATG